MLVYNYHPQTGDYTGASEADESPRQPGVFLVPAFATMSEPPAPMTGYRIVFADDAWGYVPIGEDSAPTPEPVPSEEMVINERERRLALGFDYDFTGDRGVHRIGTTERDLKGWDEVTKVAQAALLLGLPNQEIEITTDTGPVTVTAQEWQHVLLAAAAVRQPIFKASFDLQAMDPIPLDFHDDAYWP